MKNRLYSLVLALGLAGAAFGQVNSMTQTTLSAGAAAIDRVIYVTSATGINPPQFGSNTPGSELYLISPGNPRGETVLVQAVNGTAISVARGRDGAATAIPVGAVVLIGAPNWFRDYDPSGACTAANTFITPHVNTKNGAQWLCSTVTLSWVPSWGNGQGDAFAPTAAVASAAAFLPSGPLMHATGTAAITSITLPVGFVSGSFTVIPDGIFTTVQGNNIALASTAIVNKPLTFTFDPATAKFYPSY